VGETVRFERRFQGFADGALGGYAAGVVASRLDGPAEANLRSLPPLERDLDLRRGDGALQLWEGETLVLEAHGGEFELAVPDPPGLEEAEAASRDLVHDHGPHPYPGCFTCGPERAPGDGLRLFMGRAPDGKGALAAAWAPDPGLTSGPELPLEFIWGALDCPTIWASWMTDDGSVAQREGTFPVLARQRVEQLAPVPTGEPAIVTAWRISRDGRKHVTAAAIHSPDGALLARAESLLIDVAR
jgi:hypothetical protein